MNTTFNKRQTATILAALRTMQQVRGECYGGELPEDIESIRNNCGTLEPMDDDEIDALCEQINVTPDPAIIVVGCEGGLVQGASSNIEGLSLIVLDYDTEGCGDDEITEVPQSDTVELEPAIVGLHTVVHDAPWIHQICDAVGVKGLREQPTEPPPSRFDRMPLTIPDADWTQTGSTEDPGARLHYRGMRINGLSMHVEAIAVKHEGEFGEQNACDEMFTDEVGTLQSLCDTAFCVAEIMGREYIIIATPHGR